MRRKLLLAGVTLTITALAILLWQTRPTVAQPADPANGKQAKAPAAPLPIAQVILFNSGVGYFQRQGEVEGNARIDLTFPSSDVNDLLKSLVLQDLNGGKISTISYDSPDPSRRPSSRSPST